MSVIFDISCFCKFSAGVYIFNVFPMDCQNRTNFFLVHYFKKSAYFCYIMICQYAYVTRTMSYHVLNLLMKIKYKYTLLYTNVCWGLHFNVSH